MAPASIALVHGVILDRKVNGNCHEIVRSATGSPGWVGDHCCPSFSAEDMDNGECNRIALLSQEGSTIETAVEIVRGVVPEPHSLRMHSETFRLGNHPSRHRKERDDAALLTQEGNSPAFSVTIILL